MTSRELPVQVLEQKAVTYTEAGLFESYGIVVRYLNDVGLQARGPFECPWASNLR